MPDIKYKRVLLKLSGEALGGPLGKGIDADVLEKICIEIKNVIDLGVQVAIVVGGGNFWRGRFGLQMERTTSDYMGMLATVMNALAIQDALQSIKLDARVQTSIKVGEFAEPFVKEKAIEYLDEGKVVIFAGGTGNPFFTTDTAAALRSSEISADVILLAKTIDGVYSADPKIDKNAVKYDEISYLDVLNQDLKVMDSTATSLCKDNNIPIVVFAMNEPNNISKILKGEKIGTLVM